MRYPLVSEHVKVLRHACETEYYSAPKVIYQAPQNTWKNIKCRILNEKSNLKYMLFDSNYVMFSKRRTMGTVADQ